MRGLVYKRGLTILPSTSGVNVAIPVFEPGVGSLNNEHLLWLLYESDFANFKHYVLQYVWSRKSPIAAKLVSWKCSNVHGVVAYVIIIL